MKPIKILVDSLADEHLTNAQMINGREIVSRLDADRFHVTMFAVGAADPLIVNRPNTRIIKLPQRLQTLPILTEFLFGAHDILFYLKASPASRWYFNLRSLEAQRRVIVATVESQSDWQDETTTAQTRRLIERTIFRADSLFSNSEMVRRSLESNYGLRSEVVRTGVDTNFFTPHWDRPPNPRPRVLFIGALRRFKGPEVVLDAAVRFPQADFVLIGDGVLREQLCERSKAPVQRGTMWNSEPNGSPKTIFRGGHSAFSLSMGGGRHEC